MCYELCLYTCLSARAVGTLWYAAWVRYEGCLYTYLSARAACELVIFPARMPLSATASFTTAAPLASVDVIATF